MSDMAMGAARAPSRGYWIGAILSVLWMALGCAMYLVEVTMDPAAMPTETRAMMEATPEWMWAAFAIAVWVGLAGAVMLLLRRRLAVPLIAISLVAMLVQNSAYLIDPDLAAAVPASSLALPLVIMALTAAVFWFAWNAGKRGILR